VFNSESARRANQVKAGKASWLARIQKHGADYYLDRVAMMSQRRRLKLDLNRIENEPSESTSEQRSEPSE
jgi:hypothetical protein